MKIKDYQLLIDNLAALKLNPEVRNSAVFNDEPRFFCFGTKLTLKRKFTDGFIGERPNGSGTSFFSTEEALFKSLCEAIERYCLYCYKRKNLIYDTFKNNEKSFLDPALFLSNPSSRNQKIGWVESTNLLNNQKYFVPAQLVYLPYVRSEKEAFLKYPFNSTGAAAGSTPEQAILNGIYEVIERDAFVTTYLDKISPPKINLKKLRNKEVDYFLNQCKLFRLEPYVLEVTNDTGIPTYLCVIIDQQGGPPVAMGAKSSLRAQKAITGAILEALMVRMFTKYLVKNADVTDDKENKENAMYAERAKEWLFPNMVKKLDFLLSGAYSNQKLENFNGSTQAELTKVVKLLKKKSFEIYSVDITLEEFKKWGFFVYKALIPGLQPLYLHEVEKEHATDVQRLKSVAAFFGKKYTGPNKVPHPFL